MNATDALEYVMAGARAVEVGTAIAFGGVRVFGTLVTDLSSLLDELGFSRLEEAVGIAHLSGKAQRGSASRRSTEPIYR